MYMKPQYLRMRYYNDGKETVPLVFKNDRTLPFLDNDEYEVTIVKFDIDNNAVPAFIPKLFDASIDINCFNLPTPTAYEFVGQTINLPSDTKLCTNLQIEVELTRGIQTFWSNGFVEWVPTNAKLDPPNQLDRNSIVNSPYFHSYSSLHISQLIANTLTEILLQFPQLTPILSNKSVQLEKIDGKYTLLIPEDCYDAGGYMLSISFSQELDDLFGFNTVQHPIFPEMRQLIIKSATLTTVSIGYPTQHTYLVVQSGFNSSFMFPFAELSFKSDSLNVCPLLTYNNASNNSNATENILTDFTFNVSDVDIFYNKIVYTASSFDRKIALRTSGSLKSLSISAWLSTSDGVETRILIDPRRTASIMLCFTPIE